MKPQYRISWRKADKPALSIEKGQRIGILVGSLLLLALLVMPVLAATHSGFPSNWFTIGGGGMTYGTSGNEGGGTIGQYNAGLNVGFWVPGDTDTPTPTATATATATNTSTATPTSTSTTTPSTTVTRTATPPPTNTNTNTPSVSVTNTPSTTPMLPTLTPTRTPTFSPVPLTNTVTNTPTSFITVSSTPTPTSFIITVTVTPTPLSACAFHYFAPETLNGTPGPVSGGTVNVGDRFILDMMVHPDVHTVTGQQAYLSYSYQSLQNANVSSIGGSCVPTGTVTLDPTVFDTSLQNQVCNGPNPCTFPVAGTVPPGSMAFASAAFSNPDYNGPDFQVARVGFCATTPGQATLRWQFSPPDPVTRNTGITDQNGNRVNAPGCYINYTIFVAGPTETPTVTPTGTIIATATWTPINTPTDVPTGTPIAGVVLIGHVTWQGAAPQPSGRQIQAITITLKSSTTEVNFPTQNTDTYGFFTVSVSSLVPNTYNWRVKGARALSTCGTVVLTGSGQTSTEMGPQRVGDAIGASNNIVNASDVNILKSTFGSTTDLRADFNNDGRVDTLDFALLKSNFGTAGCAAIGPRGGPSPGK